MFAQLTYWLVGKQANETSAFDWQRCDFVLPFHIRIALDPMMGTWRCFCFRRILHVLLWPNQKALTLYSLVTRLASIRRRRITCPLRWSLFQYAIQHNYDDSSRRIGFFPELRHSSVAIHYGWQRKKTSQTRYYNASRCLLRCLLYSVHFLMSYYTVG